MHPNRAFRQATDNEIVDFIRSRSFGILTLAGPEGPLASHIPFIMDERGMGLEAHIVRSNPIRAALRDAGPDGAGALLIVSGPDGYVSPDWYGIEDQVPTWNYVAAHLRGRVRLAPDDELRDHLGRLSEQFETRLPEKAPWRLEKLRDEKFTSLVGMIAKITMDISDVAGTWKLGQNKPDDARLNAARGLRDSGIGSETELLAGLMSA